MEETIYKILTDESARDTQTVAENLATETTKAAPWYSWMSPSELANPIQS